MLEAKTVRGSSEVGIVTTPLGKGGEGSVYTVTDHSLTGVSEQLVYKKYHAPEEGNRKKKIAAMLKNVPKTKSVAWPEAIVFDNGMFSGYLMKKLESQKYRMWSELSNIRDRRQSSPDFSFKHGVVAARNLAAVLDSVHKAGHCVGDINESNIFVGADASILIVDTDSAQIVDNGITYPCLVGKPEYVAPEISHGSFKDNPRTIETDMYAYAVAVVQMLTGGAHPTDGAYHGAGEAPDTIDRNRAGIYPVLTSVDGYESLARIPSEAIPDYLRRALLMGLDVDPSKRISFKQFIAIFDNVLQNLQSCVNVETHYYDKRDHSGCPWCKRLENGLIDPWSVPPERNEEDDIEQQISLPAVTFNDGSNAPKVRRTNVAGDGGVPNLPNAAPVNNTVAPRNSNSYSSNGSTASNQQYTQQPSQQPEPQIPDMIKGKTVLKYTDGSWEVRPPMMKLLKLSPSTAMYCMKKEFPDFLNIWWKTERPLAHIGGLFVGLVFGLILSGLLFFVPDVVSFFWADEPDLVRTILPYLSYGMIGLGALSSFYLFFSGMADYHRTWKVNKTVQNYKKEKWWRTAVRFLPLPWFYGIFGLAFLIFFLLFLFIGELKEDARRNGY